MTGLHLHNDPNAFGRIPDPPDIEECDGSRFDKNDCRFCVNYAECYDEWSMEHES